MAPRNNSAFVHGRYITSDDVNMAIVGRFSCDDGYSFDTGVAWLCSAGVLQDSYSGLKCWKKFEN